MDENLRRVYGAGIPITVGSDGGSPLTPHGPSIYRELDAIERAGIPAAAVLVMATRNGAAAVERLDDFRTLEPGKLANLLVLGADPGASTSAFRGVTRVMRAGILHKVARLAGR